MTDSAADLKKRNMNVSRRTTATIGAVALASLVALTACSNSGSNQTSQTTSGTSASASATQAHNQADVMFAQHMIPHHRQAIQMSDMVLAKPGIDPRVVQLANQIKAEQGPEIQQMQSWLSQWGLPTMPMMPGMEMPGTSGAPSESGGPLHSDMPSPSATPGPGGMPGMPNQSMMPSGSMMPRGSMMPGTGGMAGMMSPADMTALQNAQGVDASKLFLTQMIQHHQGAITMAQNEITSGQFSPAIALARSIVTSQQQEINTMQSMLAAL